MDIKAVIFDLDGVLVFTDKYHFLAWRETAKELGIDFEEKDNDRLRGVSRAESLEIILENYKGKPLSQEKKDELLEKKNNLYREYLGGMSPDDVTKDVRDTLTELKRRGILIAVGSSSKNTSFILKKTALDTIFDAVADGTMIMNSKPDPEVFLKAAELLNVSPQDCLVIEDADAGIEAAKAAGMHSAAIGAAAATAKSNTHCTAEKTPLSDTGTAGAEVSIETISDILAFLS